MPLKPLPDESSEYRKLRSELLEAEVALRDQRERVAELRRQLPQDTPVEDHLLRSVPASLADVDAPVHELRLSELFSAPDRTLVLMHFMYGKAQTEPCPMCTLWADGYDGVIPHLKQRVDFAVLVAGDVLSFREYARSRGWRNVPVVSAGASSLKRDLGFEDEEGRQSPGVSVFRLGEDGRPRHFTSCEAEILPGQFRGMDLLSPLWHFLDLTPEGRGDFFPQRKY